MPHNDWGNQVTPFVVYEVLSDAGEVVYIGKSKNHQARWRQHLKAAGDAPLAAWVKRGNKPSFRVLCYCEDDFDMGIIERWMIERISPPLNGQRYSSVAVWSLRSIQ